MTSNSVAGLLSDLGVTRSHSRPKVSNDNPYSESWLPGSGQELHLPAPTDPDVPDSGIRLFEVWVRYVPAE